MIVYGRNPVHEALRGPRTVQRIWVTKNAQRESWLAPAARITATTDSLELERICGSPEHQGVCAEVSRYLYADGEQLLATPQPLLVVLDEVQDPQNLGSIARSAECAGVTGLVIPERRAAEVTPAVCKASAGAVEHLAIARVRNIADFLADAKRAGLWCYGADQARGGRLPPDRSVRAPGAGARIRGPRAAPASGRRLRRAGQDPAARTDRLAQRRRRGGDPDLRCRGRARPS